MQKTTAIGGSVPTNDCRITIESDLPYAVSVTIQGTADFLYHRWSVEAVREKATAKKGSITKMTDNLESYVYRTETGELAIPATQLRGAILVAAKFRQDPRSPRKSAYDLLKAAIVVSPQFSSVGHKHWDYEDSQRVVVQRNSITRTRPALKAGWKVSFQIDCLLAEYVSSSMLNDLVAQAGKFSGLGDFRPTYGRFQVIRFQVR